MIEKVLPPGVVGVESFADLPESDLFPEEAAVVARAVVRRQRQFAITRACARMGLSRLGLPPAAILPGEGGAPSWPVGVVGSMTHCDGYQAAVLARATDVATVGIDAEVNEALPNGVLDLIARTEDRIHLGRLARTGEPVCWDRLLFCAKETVYKAWFPLTRQWLGFHDAVVTINPRSRTLTARLLVPDPPLLHGCPLTGFVGRWVAHAGLLLTSIVVPLRPELPAQSGGAPA